MVALRWRGLVRAATVFTVGGVGCGAQSPYLEDQEWSRDRGNETGAWRDTESLFNTGRATKTDYRYVLRGVRHDLTMAKKAEPTKRCSCLDVVVGRPRDKKFRWISEIPLVSTDQFVVAVRTEGTKCPEGTREQRLRRPSIQAVDAVGKHTVVVVEELPTDRPQALGAIVRKPLPGGSLFVRPRFRHLPYAHSHIDYLACKVFTRPGTVETRD